MTLLNSHVYYAAPKKLVIVEVTNLLSFPLRYRFKCSSLTIQRADSGSASPGTTTVVGSLYYNDGARLTITVDFEGSSLVTHYVPNTLRLTLLPTSSFDSVLYEVSRFIGHRLLAPIALSSERVVTLTIGQPIT